MRKTFKVFTVAVLLGLAAPAMPADSDRKQTNIPAQELESALQTFAKERSMQIIFRSTLVKNLKSRALSGSMTSNEALNRLLGGTGLSYHADASGS